MSAQRHALAASDDLICLMIGAPPLLVSASLSAAAVVRQPSALLLPFLRVQVNVAKVDEEGKALRGNNAYYTYALCGYVRDKGEADMALTELIRKDFEAEEATREGKGGKNL